jgi:hypothetical protein
MCFAVGLLLRMTSVYLLHLLINTMPEGIKRLPHKKIFFN